MSVRDPLSDVKNTVGFGWPPMNITLLCGERRPSGPGWGRLLAPAPPVAVSAISEFSWVDLVRSSFESSSIAFCFVFLLSIVIITDV